MALRVVIDMRYVMSMRLHDIKPIYIYVILFVIQDNNLRPTDEIQIRTYL